MDRRAFLVDSSKAALTCGLSSHLRQLTAAKEQRSSEGGAGSHSPTISETVVPGTAPLTIQGDLAAQMVEGIHQFLLRQTQNAAQERERLWQRNYQSVEEYK